MISVASKRQWSVGHRDVLSVLHSDFVIRPVYATAVFTQATYMRYTSAPPRLDAAPARLPRNVSILENPASIPRPDPAAPVSDPGPIRPPPVQGNIPAAKKPRKARFVQEMERDEMFIPTDDASIDSKPMERRDFTKIVGASDIDPDAKLRPYVCGLCDQLTDQTTNVGKQTSLVISGRHCPSVRVGCRTCIEADGKPCPVVWRYSKCTRDEAAAQFGQYRGAIPGRIQWARCGCA